LATESQYKFYRSLYDEENTRSGQLESKAKLYITILTIFFGASIFKISDLKSFIDQNSINYGFYIYFISTICFLLSLIFAVSAVSIRKYEGLCDPEELIGNLGIKPPTDSDFFDERIVECAIVSNRNSKINDKVSNDLHRSNLLLLLGIVCYLIFTFTFLKS
jgi:hypothetical protein